VASVQDDPQLESAWFQPLKNFKCDILVSSLCFRKFQLVTLYVTDGRISLAGLSQAQCEYLANAINDSFKNVE
jgi:hypothetical protein